ncbi:MAG: DUF1036 domain-containing protein [Paracoccaceae bacterium]
MLIQEGGRALHPLPDRTAARRACGTGRLGYPAGMVRPFLVLLPFLTAPTLLRAEFAVCNQSFDVVNVAVGQDSGGDFQTEGWWTIGPNQCANVIKTDLTSRYIYIYAQDVFGQPLVSGTTQMCISPRKFQIRSTGDCWTRGDIAAGFIEVDTQKTQRWTLFLAPPP